MTVPYRAKVTGRAQGGPQLLIFDVSLRWMDGDQRRTANLVASHQIEVGAYGESGLATLFEVPTLLLIPGVLALAVIGLLWRWWPAGRSPGQTFPVSWKTPEFWFLALVGSGAAVTTYGAATGGRNLLIGYGTLDIVELTAVTVAVAAVAYLLARWFHRRLAEGKLAVEGATPLEMLQALSRRKLSVWVEQGELPLTPPNIPMATANEAS